MKASRSSLGLLLAGCAILCAPRSSAQVVSAAAAPSDASTPAVGTAPSVKPLPTTKELLQRYEAVTGGHDVWASFHSRTMKGVYQTEDSSGFAGIEVVNKEPNKSLAKITLANGMVIREVCDGKAAWLEDPRGGMHEITGPALRSRVRRANFNDRTDMLLMAITGKVAGPEKVGTHNAYVLEFSPEKQIVSKLYFDTETGLVIRVDDLIHKDDGDYKVETYMDDYRPVDGAYFPFRLRHVEKGNVFTIRLTQVKNNVAIDDSMFLKPESAPK